MTKAEIMVEVMEMLQHHNEKISKDVARYLNSGGFDILKKPALYSAKVLITAALQDNEDCFSHPTSTEFRKDVANLRRF